MSTYSTITVSCSVCGHDSEQTMICSTNTFGGMDFDMRPPEMKRSTMEHWIESCPECGYVAKSLSEPLLCDKAILESPEYTMPGANRSSSSESIPSPPQPPKSYLADKFMRESQILAKSGKYKEAFFAYLEAGLVPDDAHYHAMTDKFLRKALISEKSGKYMTAFHDYLHAAWASDDINDEAWMFEARKRALRVMEKFSDAEMNDNHCVIRADLLRKTRQFERLLREYSEARFDKNLLDRMVRFQIQLAEKKDTATYTIDDLPAS